MEDSKDLLKINEVFTSYQGEGYYTGVLTRFIRLQGCSLKCIFCDTKSAISRKGGKEMSLTEMLYGAEVEYFTNVCITGGEPLLQQDVRQFSRLVQMCLDKGYSVEVETNGTIVPNFMHYSSVHFNCSPKLKNSGMPKKYKRKAIERIHEHFGVFKFVVDPFSKNFLKEIEKFQEKYNIEDEAIMLMAEGTEFDSVVKGTTELMNTKHKYNVTTRAQVLFGVK